ncbi:hypothetical protein NDU88_000457 [Pleurodeles waltl]|uniref:Uncharacterized protein n=1 Tax=Pleurodeles waltl TaxID=8319 RepID=A0AAV7P2K7_PLEWA|nr:hypothetical protein NDU88_000457 [Pleurodeles waltl]
MTTAVKTDLFVREDARQRRCQRLPKHCARVALTHAVLKFTRIIFMHAVPEFTKSKGLSARTSTASVTDSEHFQSDASNKHSHKKENHTMCAEHTVPRTSRGTPIPICLRRFASANKAQATCGVRASSTLNLSVVAMATLVSSRGSLRDCFGCAALSSSAHSQPQLRPFSGNCFN